jgi:hypothetical protein
MPLTPTVPHAQTGVRVLSRSYPPNPTPLERRAPENPQIGAEYPARE